MKPKTSNPFQRILPVFLLAVCGTSQAGVGVAYKVEPKQSQVTFVLQATGHKVHGKTSALKGEFVLPFKLSGVESSFVAKIEFDAASLDTANKKRDRKMRTDSLDVNQYPAIVFLTERIRGEISKIRSGEPAQVTLVGKLAIRDVTRPISVIANVTRKGEKLHIEGTHVLRFTDYNVPDPSIFLLRVKKDMTIGFSIVCSPAD